MRFLERGREFLSPFGRTICFAVRFERSGPPKIFDFWGERRHWALPTRQASSVRFNCRTRAQVVEKIVRSVSWDKKQVVDVVDLNNSCCFVLQCHLVYSSLFSIISPAQLITHSSSLKIIASPPFTFQFSVFTSHHTNWRINCSSSPGSNAIGGNSIIV